MRQKVLLNEVSLATIDRQQLGSTSWVSGSTSSVLSDDRGLKSKRFEQIQLPAKLPWLEYKVIKAELIILNFQNKRKKESLFTTRSHHCDSPGLVSAHSLMK